MPSPSSKPREAQRIAKLLARAGIASRREVERMIAEGRIAIDGAVVDTPATLLPSLRGVTVDGKPVSAPPPARLFALHKPAGLLTTERDPAGRPTIYDRLPKGLPRLMPVGRLDMNTEGLLLLTTDGGLKRQLELPATGVERSYRARAYGEVSQQQLEDLMLGVEIDGIRYGSINADIERRTGANVWIELTLTEGKNREVRRVLEHLGLQVNRLIRTRYGPFRLDDLPPGEVAEIRQHDLIAFRNTLTAKGAKEAGTLAIVARPLKSPPRHGEGDHLAQPNGGGVSRGENPGSGKTPTPTKQRQQDASRGETSRAGKTARDQDTRPRARKAAEGDTLRPRPAAPKPTRAPKRPRENPRLIDLPLDPDGDPTAPWADPGAPAKPARFRPAPRGAGKAARGKRRPAPRKPKP